VRRWVLLLGLLALPAWGGEDLSLVGPGGAAVALRPAAGQVLLLHFWATWCPTCLEDLANLQQAAAACSEERLRVVAVNVGEGDAEISDFVRRHGVRLPILRDPKGRVWRKVDGRGLPMNLFWSHEGKRTDVGPKREDQWRAEFGSLGCEASLPPPAPEAVAPNH
jgi:thiol-disulfide isomerase/thioredoxin